MKEKKSISIVELNTIDDMLDHLDVIKELYPSLTKESYSDYLKHMLPNNRYAQIAVLENEKCLGIAGVWIGTKLWCGKYLEIDNLIVSSKHRSTGVGKLLFEYVAQKAETEKCSMLALDSYTSNFKAHKFFYNAGFEPKGFHFIRILNPEMING
jgi:GNAT superfamily N-acetyltransferase